MKLWDKGTPVHREVERFTTGKDREVDMLLAEHDVTGSMAHAMMLGETGILTGEETRCILAELGKLYRDIREGRFVIEEDTEDVHSQVEKILTERLGETGKKIHTGRSRNDQVLLDIRLFTRKELHVLTEKTKKLFEKLLALSEEHANILMPGYTHMQVAMPSSFGLWWGSFAESLVDDVLMLGTAWQVNDQNPLGTAAGYGSSFPVDRELTTRLLGFGLLCVNPVYAQSSRGKTEWVVSVALASVAHTLAKLATDICLFMGSDFGFLSLAPEMTTGSSIMPHKKNPDVFELIRARANRLKSLPASLMQVSANLPSGYHRDFQLIKEMVLPAFRELADMIDMTLIALDGIRVREDIMQDEKYCYCYSVEAVNQLVMEGVPFREAYRRVAGDIRDGKFRFTGKPQHTHVGSIGNPGTDRIREKMKNAAGRPDYSVPEQAIRKLLDKAGVEG